MGLKTLTMTEDGPWQAVPLQAGKVTMSASGAVRGSYLVSADGLPNEGQEGHPLLGHAQNFDSAATDVLYLRGRGTAIVSGTGVVP